jgi:hypothetical protein
MTLTFINYYRSQNSRRLLHLSTITESTTKTADDFYIYQLLQKAKQQTTFTFMNYYRRQNTSRPFPSSSISEVQTSKRLHIITFAGNKYLGLGFLIDTYDYLKCTYN